MTGELTDTYHPGMHGPNAVMLPHGDDPLSSWSEWSVAGPAHHVALAAADLSIELEAMNEFSSRRDQARPRRHDFDRPPVSRDVERLTPQRMTMKEGKVIKVTTESTEKTGFTQYKKDFSAEKLLSYQNLAGAHGDVHATTAISGTISETPSTPRCTPARTSTEEHRADRCRHARPARLPHRSHPSHPAGAERGRHATPNPRGDPHHPRHRRVRGVLAGPGVGGRGARSPTSAES